jgi:hypothetical protein
MSRWRSGRDSNTSSPDATCHKIKYLDLLTLSLNQPVPRCTTKDLVKNVVIEASLRELSRIDLLDYPVSTQRNNLIVEPHNNLVLA